MTNKNTVTIPRFNDVTPRSLQAWNRCTTFFNVCSDLGKDYGKKYVEEFTGKDRTAMMMIFTLIKTKGYDQTKQDLIKGTLNQDVAVREALGE